MRKVAKASWITLAIAYEELVLRWLAMAAYPVPGRT